MAAGSTYTPIATTTLGSAVASYTFSSIPSTYTDLVLVMSTGNSTSQDIYLQFNGDTGTNYSSTGIFGNGTAASSSNRTNKGYGFLDGGASANVSYIPYIVNIMNYANTTTYKTFLCRFNPTTAYMGATVNLWRSTAAINSVLVGAYSGNLPSGSTFTLYGITAA